jgi:hypothetical protein
MFSFVPNTTRAKNAWPSSTFLLYDFTLLYDLRKVLVAAAQGHDMIINCILLDPMGDMIVTAVHILKLERYREE